MPNLSDYNPAVKYGSNLDVNVDLADIRDANGNELLELDTVASAVNYVQIANAATGNAPAFTAAGDDTNVALQLSPAGTASVLVGAQGTASPAQAAGGVLSATISAQRGRITVPLLGIAAGSAVFIDLTNTLIAPSRFFFAGISSNAATAGSAFIHRATPGAGSATIEIRGQGAAIVNGALDVDFIVL